MIVANKARPLDRFRQTAVRSICRARSLAAPWTSGQNDVESWRVIDGWRALGIGQLHRILTRTTYIGRHEFNKRSKAKKLKPASEIVTVEVPPHDACLPIAAVHAEGGFRLGYRNRIGRDGRRKELNMSTPVRARASRASTSTRARLPRWEFHSTRRRKPEPRALVAMSRTTADKVDAVGQYVTRQSPPGRGIPRGRRFRRPRCDARFGPPAKRQALHIGSAAPPRASPPSCRRVGGEPNRGGPSPR
jgi:hypothetical protein